LKKTCENIGVVLNDGGNDFRRLLTRMVSNKVGVNTAFD
jgi:hypothetical protein